MTVFEKRLDLARARLRFCDSYTRLPTLLAARDEMHLSDVEFLRLLGPEWSGMDNIGLHPELKRLLQGIYRKSPKLLLEMMTADEVSTYRSLPQSFTVYRGCYPVNRGGLSYSTERSIAMTFPGLHRYRRPRSVPLLITAWVERDACVLKEDRGECEIIALQPFPKSIEKIAKRM